MEISTRFGPQDIDPQSIITLPRGMLGFENLTRYKLFHEEGKPTVFWLQSLDDPGIQFPVASPQQFQVDYEIGLSDEEIGLLQLTNIENAVLLVTVSKPGGDAASVQPNLLAPIILNGTGKPDPRRSGRTVPSLSVTADATTGR